MKTTLTKCEKAAIRYMIPKIDVSVRSLCAELDISALEVGKMLSALESRSLVARRDYGKNFMFWNVTYAGFLTWHNQQARENRVNGRSTAIE